jgi:hypothetical protein
MSWRWGWCWDKLDGIPWDFIIGLRLRGIDSLAFRVHSPLASIFMFSTICWLHPLFPYWIFSTCLFQMEEIFDAFYTSPAPLRSLLSHQIIPKRITFMRQLIEWRCLRPIFFNGVRIRFQCRHSSIFPAVFRL